MSDVEATLTVARDIVDHVTDSDEWDPLDWIALKHMAEYYRIRVDNNKRMFAAELPEHVAQYHVMDAHLALVEYPEEHDIPSYIVRDIVGVYREWAFLNGFRNAEPSDETLDLTDYKEDQTLPLLEELNARIEAEEATGQDAFVGLKLANTAFNRSGENEPFDTPTDALDMITEVGTVVADIVDRARANKSMDFDYNKVGGTLDFTYNELHHEGLRDIERREVAREIKNGETTAEEILSE